MATHANSTPMPGTDPAASWRQRLLLELAIEHAIGLLDELDGDADLEPDVTDELSAQPSSLRGGHRAAA